MKYRNDLKKRILAGLLAGAALCLAAPAAQAAGSLVPNGTLPDGGHFVAGGNDANIVTNQAANRTDITQSGANAVIKWDSFNVGANATVNFGKEGGGKFNTLNYVNSANGLSQIYGTINAKEGNIYIVNPAGVEIGNSAQINTGSLYVSNKRMTDENLTDFQNNAGLDTIYIPQGTTTDAALMSLGNINANTVTFEGSRIVIDTERIKDVDGDNKLVDIDHGQNITIRTTNENNVVIGYKGYDEDNKAYDTKEVTYNVTKIDEKGNVIDNAAKVAGYMWVEDVEQLQAIGASADTLKGNYALRNSIDATATQDWNVVNDTAQGFESIGSVQNAFTGKFDGLDYNIFNLNINRGTEDNVGLFGVVGNGAVINNVTLVGGSITGQNYVGSLAGAVRDGASISNITNSAKVNGNTSVGGIIGQSNGGEYTNLVNTGTVTGDTNNIGGLIGNMSGGSLGGTSYNLGAVTAKGYNVGGLVGHAYNATIGNQGEDAVTVYNRLNVTGAYNVGGIVGNMEGSTVQNAENSGNVTAEGFANDGRYKGSYTFHTANTADDYSDGKSKTVDVNTANVGGIAGISSSLGNNKSTISDVLNTGNVNSSRQDGNEYYDAGNVGGVVGSAVDTDITNATNRENEIRGAHNVGGIAGYFSGAGVVSNGINDGGDIMATGARYEGKFVTEIIRPFGNSHEEFIIGNMGGIVGYLEGDNVSITNSANRGTVHTYGEYTSANDVPDWAKVANAGGIAGKIDRSQRNTMVGIKNGTEIAAISNSYNTGNVRGYTGVGGIAGLMYNGAIASSHNEGYLSSTRQSPTDTTNIEALNMGGIVGDTTENSNAYAILYDVYNKGQIGDNQYEFFGRHVAGIAGRLTGEIDKAYNTGDIYNGFSVVGGIAGWMTKGSITNSFNTGNITVYNQNQGNNSQVGGIVGATGGSVSLNNVYNLGTLRSFRGDTAKANSLGGIIGQVRGGTATITSAYTMGNLYIDDIDEDGKIGSIYGYIESGSVSKTNTYYIRPDENLNGTFTNLYDETNPTGDRDNSNKAIAFAAKDNAESYQYDEGGNHYSLGFSEQSGGTVNLDPDKDGKDNSWRIYKGTTPILNAFLPNAEDYFSTAEGAMEGIGSIQYGTAYDPLLTIIHAKDNVGNLTLYWDALKARDDAGFAVYGAGLNLENFGTNGYFGGLIYSDGALTLNAHTSDTTTGDVALGSASQLYGSSVAINADGQVTIYGSVTATGNEKDGTGNNYEITDEHRGDISITGGSVDVYGQLTSARNEEGENTVFVPGIDGMADHWSPVKEGTSVSNPKDAMNEIGDWFGHTTVASAVTGKISITANDAEDGHVNVYYGNKGEGIVTTGGDLTVNASGDIYMDSDLSIGGNLTLNAGYKEGEDKPAAGSEAVLDISNIGKVQAANDDDASHTSNYYLNEFLTHFADEKYNITLGGDKTKLAVDMWGDGAFDLTKYDYKEQTLAERINALNLSVNGTKAEGQDYTYIWVSTGEQLAGIQQYYNDHKDDEGGTGILSYNFALKNDIDASNVRDYKAIGSGEGNEYTGTFDGRDNRIIGLTMTGDNAGIFDTIGAGGTVEDLRVYSGTFTGTTNAGTVVGMNHGTISNVTAFGNVVEVLGNEGTAGGIVGANITTDTDNKAVIDNATAIGTVTVGQVDPTSGTEAVAGGIAGVNGENSEILDSSSNSAVNASAGNATALGGVAGVNEGTLSNVDSLGVTTGIYRGNETKYSHHVGGIVGTNNGTVNNAYNESIVSGDNNVGGIIGANSGTVSNVANAASVTGEGNANAEQPEDKLSHYVGGLAGSNSGTITGGRNNGEITGNNYVGGLVGSNGTNSTLTNLVNDSAAAITGDNYVGGIAGSNAGSITASSVDEDGQVIEGNDNLINRGTITGQQYVGGVAGVNTGTIANTNNDVDLYVKDSTAVDDNAPQYFGGVAGWNKAAEDDDGNLVYDNEGKLVVGTITNATNHANVSADGASYVGGVVGKNDGVLSGMNGNYGTVSGKDFVGGVAGENTQALSGVNAVNQGDVTAKEGGAGGIFAVNSGKITDSTFTSSGAVSGTTGTGASGTGGIFGVNEADIENSTLENKGYTDEDDVFHDSIVTGTSNTGGLIGINTGDVSTSSLKNEADIKVEGDNVSNIGGLIGQNSGTITGGQDANDSGYYKYQIYNNGTITVTDSGSNIGGLIGNNAQENGKAGSLTAGYNTGAIEASGSTNVGGIAGTNAGTLDQVFNTVIAADGQNQTITGSTSVGGIAGTNTGSISNAYNTSIVTGTAADAVSGSIAGTNSNTADDSISNVYSTVGDNLVGSGNAATHVYDSENGFDEENEEGSVIDKDGTVSDAPWRQYGDNNPILKVFLTQLTVNETGNDKADGKTLDEYLNLVYNGKEQDINIQDLIDKGFITGPDGMIKKDEDGNSVSAVSDAHKNTMKNDGTPDSALLYNTGNKKDAGDYYNWIASAQIAAGNDGNPNNLGYDIDFKDNEITIGKATIKVTLEDIYRIYGNSQMYTDKDHTKTANGYDSFWSLGTTTEVAGAADDLKNVSITVTSSSDGAVNNLAPGKTTTNNVGDYNWGVTVDISNISQNYQLEGAGNTATSHSFTGEGKSHVGKADLNITAGSDTIYVGGTPHFSGTVDHFVNGDSFHIDFGLSADNADLPQIADTHNGVVGFWYDNRFYTSGTQGLQDLFGGNYNVTFKPGTLTVLALPDGMPDIPEIPGIENHWNGLLGDNPWDRNRDFRERKAEIHYIAGGMTL